MKTLLVSLIMFCAINTYAQDDRLLTLYSSEQLENIKANTPEVIDYLETFLNKGWIITEAKDGQEVDSEIQPESLENFNPFEYQIFPKESIQYIKIKGTKQFVIVYPKSHLIYKYNQKR